MKQRPGDRPNSKTKIKSKDSSRNTVRIQDKELQEMSDSGRKSLSVHCACKCVCHLICLLVRLSRYMVGRSVGFTWSAWQITVLVHTGGSIDLNRNGVLSDLN